MGKDEKPLPEKEKVDKKEPQSPEKKLKENDAAAEKLKTAAEEKEPEKPKWTFKPVDATGVGDEKTSITSVGPTLTSPNGVTKITASYTSMTERPNLQICKNLKEAGLVGRYRPRREKSSAVSKLGNSIKNLFKKKK